MFARLEKIDRRVIYLFVLISLATPLTMGITMTPVPLPTSSAFYDAIEKIPSGEGMVLISADWGPNTKAENKPQTEVAIEHLMRRRIPFAITTLYPLAEPFMRSIPEEVAAKLEKETGEKWEYGKDWVNVGFKPGSRIMIQSLAKSEKLADYWKTDANGTPLENIQMMENITDLKDIKLLLQFTGLVGTFNAWIGYFSVEDYRPDVVHGCTSITIPEARTYFASSQIVGLLEGVAGAAAYEKILSDYNPKRESGEGWKTNTGLAFAQLTIIGFIFLGNLGLLFSRRGGGE